MARIARSTLKIFAASAADNGQFGSAQLGTKVLSNDVTVLQALSAWSQGWLAATLGAKKFPALEEFQGIQYVTTTQIAYLFQEGIPAWDAGTTYYQNSIVKQAGTYTLYGSLVDDNTGNALTDDSRWVELINLAAPTASYYVGNAPSTGSANAQVVAALTPSGYDLTPGNVVSFVAGVTNTGALTLNINSTGAIATKKSAGGGALVDLAAGDVTITNTYSFLYNGTFYVLQTTLDPSAFLQKSANLSDVANAATSRANLGLGSAATHGETDFLQTANNLSDVPTPATARTNLGLGTIATLSSRMAVKTWVRFVGNSAAITDQVNVASITRHGTGDYSINFTSALADANYGILATGCDDLGGSTNACNVYPAATGGTDPSTTSCRIVDTTAGLGVDSAIITCAILGG